MTDIATLLDQLNSSDPEKFTAFDRLRVHAGTDGYDFFDTEHAQEVLDWCEEAAAYLRASPSQVAPQPQAGEPVAWLIRSNSGGNTWAQLTPDIAEDDRDYVEITPLYASPQLANPAQVTDATDEAVRLAGDILMSHGLNAPEQVIYRAAREILETATIGAGGQAVAVVKPLEWDPFWAETPFGYYYVDDQTDRSANELEGRPPFLLTGSRLDLSRHPTLEAAKAAAQADYERRILSAKEGQS